MKLLPMYIKMHEHGKFVGGSLKKHIHPLKEHLKYCKTVLDYGCGKGKHHAWAEKSWGIKITPYDPAVKGWDVLPEGQFDAVICTDVLEHIPEDELQETLDIIYSKAKELVYLSIATKPAKKVLPNGKNAHCTVHPKEWWEERLPKTIKTIVYYD